MKILIIRTSAIGDVFLAGQFAEYAKKAYPNAEIHWLAEKRCAAPLVKNPYIDRLILWERDKKKGIKGLFDSSRHLNTDKKYDLVIDLQCLLKLFFLELKIKGKTKAGTSEYEFPMNIFYNKTVKTKRFEPLKEKYYRIAKEILGYDGPVLDPPVCFGEDDLKKAKDILGSLKDENFIGCIFATSKIHKFWDRDKWIDLSEEIKKRYNMKCVLFGAPGDREYADYLTEKSDNFISAAGKTSIQESMACLSLCRACVSTDTALMHFASVLNIPTISLYGTNFFFSHHLGRENVKIIYKGNWENKDRKVPDDECMKNMQAIEVADITQALDTYLAKQT